MVGSAVIVIPVYNEAANIAAMIEHLTGKTFKNTAWNCSILVVDGNSPDGTADVVRAAQAQHREVHLLIEHEKEGIGAAYFKGFDHAINHLGADVLIEFDGDFQHPPETIPALLNEIEKGADLVLGSRKRPGGSYPRNWNLKRLFLSKFGGGVARLILFFPRRTYWEVTDPTTGLKATRVNEKYRALDFSKFTSRSFAYKIEMLFRLAEAGARIAEIPLDFRTREEGESKISSRTPLDMLKVALWLRLSAESSRRFLKFSVVGLTGYFINALLLEYFARASFLVRLTQHLQFLRENASLSFLAQPAGWAAALAVEGSIISNFLWNHLWTFHSRRTTQSVGTVRKFAHFNLFSLGSVLVQFLSMCLATHFLGNSMRVRQITLILTIGLLIVPLNWFIYNKIIWKHGKRQVG